MTERLRIGLIGWGTVGSALGELVRAGPLPLTLESVAVRDRKRPDLPKGIAIVAPEETLDADVVVELAGGIEGPLTWARLALDRGKPYVTANKALLATHGRELADLADRRVAALLASASVGGGTPMIETVTHLAATGAIERIRGIVNATTTYMLSAMGQGRTYDGALREAQEAGFAEADPSFDVDGRDAAQKLAILASVAWGKWRPETEVDTNGIVGLNVPAGETVRLVAEATKEAMSVKPIPLEARDPLAQAAGIENILEITVTDAGTFRISGPGAGGRVTAGAVYADLGRLVAGERPILFGAR
ncbi:MAG TPA: homoserine dehydrogenase [Candidatus Limnocylindrales bacterium]|nr:homoserine dehydrogenase [Candidatus Limnocylindrales bacterium]